MYAGTLLPVVVVQILPQMARSESKRGLNGGAALAACVPVVRQVRPVGACWCPANSGGAVYTPAGRAAAVCTRRALAGAGSHMQARSDQRPAVLGRRVGGRLVARPVWAAPPARSTRERMSNERARATTRICTNGRASQWPASFSFTSPCCSPLISARTPSLRSAPSPLPSPRGWRHICTPLNVSLHCHDPSLRACAVSCCWSHRT